MGGPVDRTPAPQPAAGVYTHDVFLSYTHDVKDDVARPLAEGLEKKGVSVWWDHSAVEIGDSLPQKIREGLDGARYGVVIVSRGYLDSGWGRTELGAMFGSGRAVFPVLYGVSAEAAKKRLPSISEAYMQVWKDPPAPIIRKIADKVNKSRGEGKVGRAADAAGGGDWKAPLDASSRGSVVATPRAINGKTIPRTSEALGIERLLAEHGRVAVVGDRGSGKSALMCQVHGRLEKSTTAVFVKGDDFLGVESADELDGRIVPGHSFVRLVGRAASAKGGAVVIIDSLDSMARDRKAMAAFKHLIKEVWGAGAKTVVTVRSYDYRHSALIASTDWGAEYDLDALSAGQVSEALARMGGPRVPDELVPLLASPLNLYLLSRISGPGGGRADLSKIGGEVDLYDAHWHRHVEQDAMPGRVRDALYGAARRMVEAGRTAIPRSLLDRDAEAADQALRAGVLRRVPGTDRVAFFHHAYLDYVASRAMLEDGPGVVGLLGSNEYNMFVRPTLPLTFMMAYKRGPREFAGLAAKVLGSGLKHYWKMTAASALARIRGGSAGDYVRLGRLLTGESMLQRHFLSEAASERNGFWLGAWGGSFLEAWASDKANPNGEFLAAYARAATSAAATPADPGSRALAFSLLRLVAENSQSGAARERAVRLMAGVDAPGKAAWLESASGSGDARARAGVAHALPDLIHTDPGSVPAIFARLFAYEEAPGGRAVPAGGLVRDNAMIKWKLEKEFPGMLKERPDVMIKSAMLAVERIYAAADPPSLPDAGRLIDAGPGSMLRALLPRHPRSVVVPAVRAYLKACDDGEFDALAPLLAGSRLGVFRSMLVDGMAGRGDAYLARLVDELADPRAYELHSMRASVRGAIGRIAGRLEGGQLSRILEAIMESNRPGGLPESANRHEGRLRAQLHADMPPGMPAPGEENRVLAALGLRPPLGDTEESARLRGDLARAEFLAEFPEEMLNNDQLELVKARRQRAAAAARPSPPPEAPPSRGMPAPATARRPRKESITGMIGRRQDREGRIALLESISEYLDDPGGAADGALLDRIEGCLLESAKHPDPDCGAADHPDTLVVDHPTVRGLAALCLTRMVALRRGGEAEDALRALSKDPSGVVRAGVARGLARLLPSRYDLAYPILLEYSRDPDARVRLFLGDRFDVVMNRDPAQASAVVQNVLAAGGPPMLGTVDSLLWLALKKRDTRAASLLDRVVGGSGSSSGGGPRDILAEIPFALQPYLSSRDHRDAALGLLYRLIEAGPEDVRSNAAFFTFNGPEGGDGDAAGRDHARRVAPHIGLLASLFDGGQFDLQTAEHAMQFLETRWSAAPGTALSCLEAVARNGADPARQPVLAPCTASIISGMIELYMPGDGEWERCLDILDVYAAAGWPEILELLASMERPD